MIYLIISFFINSQTHCGSYIKPSLGNSGLFNAFYDVDMKKKKIYIYTFPPFNMLFLMVSSKQVC